MPIKALILAPAERADVLVDFGPLAGKTLVVTNSKPPKPVVTPAPNLAQVMRGGHARLGAHPQRDWFLRGGSRHSPDGAGAGRLDRGLLLGQPHGRHASDAHAPLHAPGGRPSALRCAGVYRGSDRSRL